MTTQRHTAADHGLLRHGELAVEGRLVEASNTTLRCWVTREDVRARCVYKPVAGERPLWDFPQGTLAGREVAAWLVSEAAGWGMVPPTVLRDGPLGAGACQLWMEDGDTPLAGLVPEETLPADWHRIAAAEDPQGRRYVLAHAEDSRLAQMALFDAVVNNADRKAGHVLVTGDGRLYGVDHGVCFHAEPKLRTVLWGWAGAPLPPGAGDTLDQLAHAVAGEVGSALAAHLETDELAALGDRIEDLRRTGRFPEPDPDWPAIPWPPV